MIDTQNIPDFFRSMAFDTGITAEFNHESLIMFYNSDDEEIMRLDPNDVMILYSAYRGMVRERLEERMWSNKEIL